MPKTIDPGLIYDQHKAAFATVSAWVILDTDGNRVATVAIRYPTAGLRLWAYVHLIGLPMVRAAVGGGGYDKASAAVGSAIAKIRMDEDSHEIAGKLSRFQEAAKDMDRKDWTSALAEQGFRPLSAV